MGQEITLSLDWSAVYKGKDTILDGFAEAPVKLVVWYDSLLCGSCEVVKGGVATELYSVMQQNGC